ncbi:hypothetical protein WG66_009057 [Moniliophthora roreri]|nr:hypothetical protein WG66_009057 [Moniliophthora roreri]
MIILPTPRHLVVVQLDYKPHIVRIVLDGESACL